MSEVISKMKLIGLISGLCLVTAAIVLSTRKDEILGEAFDMPESAEQLMNEDIRVELTYDYGEQIIEDIRVSSSFDEESNTIYLGIYTHNYKKQDWEGEEKYLPINNRHTKINDQYTKIFILHPNGILIANEQKAYVIPQYSWDQNLVPFEQHEEAQMIFEGGEEIVDFGISLIPVPFINVFLDSLIESSKESQKEKFDLLREKIKAGYQATIVPQYHTTKVVGNTITAREYKIQINRTNSDKDISLYLCIQVALGETGNSAAGSLPYKFGRTELFVKEFTVKGKKAEKEIFDDDEYLLNEAEEKEMRLIDVDVINNPPLIDSILYLNINYGVHKTYSFYYPNPDRRNDSEGGSLEFAIIIYKSRWNKSDLISRIEEQYYSNINGKNVYPFMNDAHVYPFIINRKVLAVFNAELSRPRDLYSLAKILLSYQKRHNADLIFWQKDKFNQQKYFTCLEDFIELYEKRGEKHLGFFEMDTTGINEYYKIRYIGIDPKWDD